MRLLPLIFIAFSLAASADFGLPPVVETTYSLRELVQVLPALTKGVQGDKCELKIIPKSNSLVIGLRSNNATWGIFDDSFELTGAQAKGYGSDISRYLAGYKKIRRLDKIASVKTYGTIQRSLTVAIGGRGFSITIARDVVGNSIGPLNSIKKCFLFTHSNNS